MDYKKNHVLYRYPYRSYEANPSALIVSIFPIDSVSYMRGSPYDVQT